MATCHLGYLFFSGCYVLSLWAVSCILLPMIGKPGGKVSLLQILLILFLCRFEHASSNSPLSLACVSMYDPFNVSHSPGDTFRQN